MRSVLAVVLWCASLLICQVDLTGCARNPAPKKKTTKKKATKKNAAEPQLGMPQRLQAQAFMDEFERKVLDLWIQKERTQWVQNTYINDTTNQLMARADAAVMRYIAQKARESRRFRLKSLSPVLRRKFALLRVSERLPAPPNAALAEELAGLKTAMESMYGRGKLCRTKGDKKECLTLGQLAGIMAKSQSYDELKSLWEGWRQISVPMRKAFMRFVTLANQGAKSMDFNDLGELWRSKYDLPAAKFAKEVDRLWKQVEPLYRDLHCHVRAKLRERYGDKVPEKGPIPAHLLGNMWAQDWGSLFDLLAPEKAGGLDVTRRLQDKKVDPRGLVRYAERFFVSLGFPKLPGTFWKRSLFEKPRDREVVCHASAWAVDYENDLRLKMCIQVSEDELTVIHHELGHIYYYWAYRKQPSLFRWGANHGFHEAVGDTIALSVTPGYLAKIGLLEKEPPDNLNPLMKRALGKVAFLPFGLIVDKWRWGVFSGRTKPASYNRAWWALRRKYQGVTPPSPRPERFFDPGAKFHIPANVPYVRYFIAAVLQFQFHQALCRLAGHQGPLHRCSVFGNKKAGARLIQMLSQGQSRPWPETLKMLTGTTEMDARAMLEYFKPLHNWLKKQNKGRACGW